MSFDEFYCRECGSILRPEEDSGDGLCEGCHDPLDDDEPQELTFDDDDDDE